MRIAGRNIDNFPAIAGHAIVDDRIAQNVAEADRRLSGDHAELFDLAVVIVVATFETRVRYRNENLSERVRLDEFGEHAAWILTALQRIGQRLRLQVRGI